MSVQVYGCNHVAIEVDDVEKAVTFYKDVFNLEQMSGGEGDASLKLGDHQSLAIFEVDKVQRANMRHFGIMVRDETQLEEVRKKLTEKRRKAGLNLVGRDAALWRPDGAPRRLYYRTDLEAYVRTVQRDNATLARAIHDPTWRL